MTKAQSGAPTVTIGLPVFNGADYLQEAIDSLLAQTFTDFELIISDNASTDATREICERAAARDGRIIYQRLEQNAGAAPNYNRIIAEARGLYFKWAAHDDRCRPDFLQRCVDTLEQNRAVVLAYPATSVIDGEGREIRVYRDGLGLRQERPQQRLGRYLELNFLGTKGMCNPIFGLIRTDALRGTRLIQDFMASDRSLLGHLALLGEFVELDDVLFERRIHLQTSTMANLSFHERKRWFNPASAASRRRGGNNYLSLRITHLADYWRAISELVPGRGARLACRRAMLTRLVARPQWLWRDIKYSLGHAPTPQQILTTLHQNRAG